MKSTDPRRFRTQWRFLLLDNFFESGRMRCQNPCLVLGPLEVGANSKVLHNKSERLLRMRTYRAHPWGLFIQPTRQLINSRRLRRRGEPGPFEEAVRIPQEKSLESLRRSHRKGACIIGRQAQIMPPRMQWNVLSRENGDNE